MKVTLPKFKNARVMVVGDIMLDCYWSGTVDRISPEAPVPVVRINNIEERPGGAANVAMNIASLGSYSHLIGFTGVDHAACVLKKKLTQINVKCDFISSSAYSTFTKVRVISRNQQMIRLDFEENMKNFNSKILCDHINRSLDNTNIIVFSDYYKGTLKNIQQMIQLARKALIPILIDPKGNNFESYRGATLLKPNFSEFEKVVGKCASIEDIVNQGMKLITDLELSALLVTRSEQGMTLLQFGKDPLHIPTQTQEVYDVTGAGDTVIGVLAAALAAGNTLEVACHLANTAAGIVVKKLGSSTVLPIELENAIHCCSDTSFGIITEDKLKIAIDAAHKRGEKIVMTNGVFDILHAGHIAFLANARKLGDRLIVAVNSDYSTKRLKGETRPVNPLKQRMILLNALKCVDWVISFEEDTPQSLITRIMPDLLVKGGDYKSEQISGSKEVWANGGKVITLNFESEYSTSNIIEKIQKKASKL